MAKGGGVEVRFASYADGSTKNKYGVQIYKPGEPLFALSKTGGGIVTTLASYKANLETPAPGSFFKKR